jgi:capsular polysaccharide biosynthesis protein
MRLLTDPAAEASPVEAPEFEPGSLARQIVAPAATSLQPKPLWTGTNEFAEPWLVKWHAMQHVDRPRPVHCYYAQNAIVSGSGELWVDGALLCSRELMPEYAFRILELDRGGSQELQERRELPVRVIERPCVPLVGHGTYIYGHFLLEMLPRLLVARAALAGTGLRPSILLSVDSPPWLLKILTNDLRVSHSDLEFFDPATERIELRKAILPELLYNDDGFHPVTAKMVAQLSDELASEPNSTAQRIFVSRVGFINQRHDQRKCLNEPALARIAEREHGFVPVPIETLPWAQQVGVFLSSRVVAGLFGSGLHNAFFSPSGTRIGAVGRWNLMQSHIGTLRQHDNAYLNVDVQLEYTVDEALFRTFLDALVAEPPSPEAREAAGSNRADR